MQHHWSLTGESSSSSTVVEAEDEQEEYAANQSQHNKRRKTYFSPQAKLPTPSSSHSQSLANIVSYTNIEDKIYFQNGIQSMQGLLKKKIPILYYVLCVLTLGVIWLLVRFSEYLRAKLLFKSTSYKNAQFILLKVRYIILYCTHTDILIDHIK
jgi:hypothetical protein